MNIIKVFHAEKMYFSNSNNSFDDIKQKINEIKRKNHILCKKLKSFELIKTPVQNDEIISNKEFQSDILDEKEVSAVEYCYKKATKLAEYHIRLKEFRKQQRINSKITFNCQHNFDKYFTVSKPNSVEKKAEPKRILYSSGVNYFTNNSCCTVKKQCPVDKNETVKSFELVDLTILPTSLNKKPNSAKRKVPNKLSQNSYSFTKFISPTKSFMCGINNDICDNDVVYLQSINLSSDKGEKIVSLADKFNVQDASKSKHVSSNFKNKNFNVLQPHKLHNLNSTCNQDSNTILEKGNSVKKTAPKKTQSLELTGSAVQKHIQACMPEVELTTEALSEGINNILAKGPTEVVLPTFDLTKEVEVLPEIDLTEELIEDVIPVLDLTKESVEGDMLELEVTNENAECTVPELDLTEEPIDFLVPELHLNEAMCSFSNEKSESFKSRGIAIRNTNWSVEETDLLKRNFKDFQSQFGIYDVNLLLGFGRNLDVHKSKNRQIAKFLKAKHFYLRLGKDINERTIKSIYMKARRMFSRRKLKDFTPHDRAAIMQLHSKYGNKWNLIGQKLGIFSDDCYQIYSTHKKNFFKGKWSKQEQEKLILAIKSIANISNLNNADLKGISWERVSELVYTRNAGQCQMYWMCNLSKTLKNVSYKKWGRFHSAKLIILLRDEYPVTDECYIPWKKLQEHFVNVTHSEFDLKKKWHYIKHHLPEKLKTNFYEMIEFSYKKYRKYFT